MINKLPYFVTERIMNYVYILRNNKPYISEKLGLVEVNRIVYVGKGKASRAFSHNKEEWYINGDCSVEFVAIKLTEETAFHVESAMISTIGLENLENKVSSLGSQKRYLPEELVKEFDIQPLILNKEDVGRTLLVVYNPRKTSRKKYNEYDSATKWWVLNYEKAKNIKTILRMNKETKKIDVVVENISNITKDPLKMKRWGFDNDSKDISKNSKYIGKWAGHIRTSSANPIQYL